jgi:predicted esterase
MCRNAHYGTVNDCFAGFVPIYQCSKPQVKPILHNIETTRTARYFSVGSFETASELWMCLHGYAHRAESFIENFRPITTPDRLIIAPEGLSRFYTRGFGGRVGASWMTREDRLNEIHDYVMYIEKLYYETIEKMTNKPDKIVLFGFSQGVPAILRSIAEKGIQANEIVMWSGDVPRDLNFEGFILNSLHARKWLVYSKSDPLVRDEIYEETKSLLTTHSIPYELIHFEGGHEIPEAPIKELVSRL